MSADDTRPEAATGTDLTRVRPPFWVVGVALLALVLALLSGAVLLDRRSRPRVGIEPTTAISAVAEATALATHSGASPTSSTTSSSSGQSTVSIETERQIEEAYRTYLRTYSEAVSRLTTNRLHEVLDGRALQLVTDEVNDLKARGRPVQIVEDERTIAVANVTETSATLIDEYTSRSVYINPTTMQPMPRSGPPTRVRQSYEFRKINGAWKIVDGTRESLGGDSR